MNVFIHRSLESDPIIERFGVVVQTIITLLLCVSLA